MADYVVRVEASTEDAEKKLKRVDEKVVKLEKGASIDIRLPSAEQTLSTLQKVGATTADVAKKALAVSRAINVGPGAVINDLVQVFDLVKSGAQKTVSAVDLIKKSTPQNILGTAFSTASGQAIELSRRIASVGYEIFGLTQSVTLLKQTFGGLFSETIGREIRLQESLLRTRTTLASTADVAVNGKRLTDPYEALVALEKPVERTIENIRRRSLDIAGTTSDAIVQVFGVVASQVGAFGGTLKDAEDLAITFAGALGTIGMSDPMLATQEIRSILTGNIDQNSVLARSLGLTNDEITKAKTSAEGLVGFLTRRLSAFTAGQKLAAQGFAGITSNIQEVKEEALRSLGKPLLEPILSALTALYQRLQTVFDQILKIADGLGRIGSSALGGILSGISAANIFQKLSSTKQVSLFDSANQVTGSLAVAFQAEIDKTRPLIAKLTNEFVTAIASLGTGLASLAKGFALFKWEQLKVFAQTLVTVGEILNSTIVPALTNILKLYGDLLGSEVFRYIAQFQVAFKALESAGILPFVRIIYFVRYALWDSLKTAYGWITDLVAFVRKAVNNIKNATAEGVTRIGEFIKKLGEDTVATVTQLIIKIVYGIAGLVQKIGQYLIALGAAIQAEFPKYGQVGVVISNIGRALNNVDKAAQSAAEGVKKAAQSMKGALMEVKKAADSAAQTIRNVGQTISNFLGDIAGKAGGKLKEFAVGFIKFQVGMLAWEAATAGFLAIWSGVRRAANEASQQTRAEQAVQRLSTAYSELGDNASAAAKALKAYEESIVSNRLESITKQYGELADKLREIEQLQRPTKPGDFLRVAGAMFNPANILVKPRLTGNGTQETFAQALQREKKAEQARLQAEIERLSDFQKKEQQQSKAREDVRILARERTDIEAAVKEYRKKVEREIADEQFKTAQEVGKLQQSIREEARRAERSELERRLARESQGLTGVRQQIAQVLGDYERSLFDAQTEAQRRQFEAVQARESLEKAVADYKFRLEEDTAKLRKRMGDYNKEVADYERAQKEAAAQAVLQYAIKANRVATTGFVPGPGDKEKLLDAFAGNQISAQKALAYLYAGGAPKLGVQPGSDMDSVVKALAADPTFNRLINSPNFERDLNLYTKDSLGQAQGGSFAIQAARDDFNLNRWYNQKLPPPPKLQGFDDLSKSNNQAAAERRTLGERILALSKTLNDFLVLNARGEALNKAKDALSNPNLLSALPSLQEAQDSATTAARQLELFSTALKSGQNKVDSLTSSLSDFDETVNRSIEEFVRNRFLSVNSRLPANKRLNEKDLDSSIKIVTERFVESAQQSIAAGKPVISEGLKQSLQAFGKEGEDLIIVLLQNVIDTRKRIQAVTPLLDRTSRLQAVLQDLQNSGPALQTLLEERQLNTLNEIGTLAAGDSPLKQRRFEGEMINLRRTLEYQRTGKSLEAEGQAVLAQLNAETTKAYEGLGQFDEALKAITTRLTLARDIVQSLTEGFKGVAKTLLTQGDVRGAIDELSSKVTDTIFGSLLESAFAPAKQMLEGQLQGLFGVNSEQTKNTLALNASNNGIAALNTTTNSLITSNTTLNTTLAALPAQIQTAIATGASAAASGINGSPVSIPVVPNGGVTDTAFTDTQLQDAGYAMGKDLAGQKEQRKLLKDLNRGLAAVTQTVVGVTMAFDGLKRVTEGGGTYETLMGLSSIFMGVGSVLSGIGSIGKKAAGGPVYSRTPYLVGEMGPELFVPGGNGSIIPNGSTEALLASRNALGGKSTAAAADVFTANRDALSTTASLTRERSIERYLTSGASSTEIKYSRVGSGDLPFVTENDMLQATRLAAQEGARMGQQRTLAALRNDPSARRAIAI